MASATLPFCSCLTTIARFPHTHHQNPQPITSLPFSRPNPTFLSPSSPSLSSSSPKLILSSIASLRPTFSLVPMFSASEAPVIESEPGPVSSAIETTAIVETSSEKPKREEIFAVVMIGSRQYIVFPGRFIYTQRLKGANVNDKITLNKVLLVGTRTCTWIGKPVVPTATVHAVVEEQGLNDKVVVFKYKPKKNYRRNIGHRQPNTRIRITGITGHEDSPGVMHDSLNLGSS